MAVKTITIDIEAYERLKSLKLDSESFSDVVKRIFPKPFDLNDWLKSIEKNRLSDETLDVIEDVVSKRGTRPRRRG